MLSPMSDTPTERKERERETESGRAAIRRPAVRSAGRRRRCAQQSRRVWCASRTVACVRLVFGRAAKPTPSTERLDDAVFVGTNTMTSSTPERAVSSKGSAVSSLSRETKATLASDLGSLGSEQDAHKICTALQFCLSQLPKEQLARVARVAVSGQMHGVVLWRHGSGWKRNAFGRFDVDVVSALYTWQDGRCSAAFLDALPKPRSHLRLSSGHGCATLFWLLKHRARELERFDRAGAVQDLVVAMLCGLDKPVMSTQTAASWGYFDTVAGQWNTEL
ncbi:hypothetical protein MTO96_030023 [Rhipicephalus appendiculatus]